MATSQFLKSTAVAIAAALLVGASGALECPAAQAQRLARPGTSAVLPSGQRVFNLGVEAQGQGAVTAPAASNSDPFAGQSGAGMFDRGRGGAAARFPELNVGLGNREKDLPVLGVKPFSIQLLAKYDLELIVDQSMSMLRRDCPGFSSRWDWCGDQAQELANQLAPYVPSGLTITAFARRFDVHQQASAQNIADLFQNPDFGRGTRLAEPLSDRLESYFARRRPGSKPVLIGVITDGVPTPEIETQMVIDTIIQASRRVKDPREVTIVFFQIGGGDAKGRFFLDHLDRSLLADGARYDIVQTVSFDRLEQVGLARALVDSVQDFARKSGSR
ncbi:MAG: hypothetical protein JSS86_16170 [Cyanobacteria bacterium SZAS LIN-2]|nr:hypothetical protein [Cyanobacteria bacterium SZAS LIN-3]MBS1997861.1 hypothetical protein [Cyanobacteria bacterium SZAS LIN-2]